MVFPCRWHEFGWTDFAGRVRFNRRFGYPGRIDDHERVWLTVAGVEASADMYLNGTAVGHFTNADGAFEVDVTALLKPRNELSIVVEGGTDGGLWGEVAMEVKHRAFLRGVVVERMKRTVEVRGEVVGIADGPLELYVVMNRFTVAYLKVTATPEGTPFRLTGEIPSASPADEEKPIVKVDLVDGATVCYTIEKG